ncbi:hypothetical protein [Elizabethkingia anophelis]|uniref:hypothetical protein n=1 Tax=Elizabethkingia anophelis TaxID=1117645 RepID=UPI00113275A1|nr:hypothetical protein [Elizabethkingia anophelis]
MRLRPFVSLPHQSFVVFPTSNPQPFSDAELKQCRDLLIPIGYTLVKKSATNEIILYRVNDHEEEKKLTESIVQTLKQDV